MNETENIKYMHNYMKRFTLYCIMCVKKYDKTPFLAAKQLIYIVPCCRLGFIKKTNLIYSSNTQKLEYAHTRGMPEPMFL